MKICDDGHDEICFDGRNCPCCYLIVENSDLEKKLESAKEEIKFLESENELGG